MTKHHWVILYLLTLLVTTSCEVKTVGSSSEPKFNTGDNPRWAAKSHDDRAWSLRRGNTEDSVFWARFPVRLSEEAGTAVHLGVNILAFGAYEAYWDGVLIGRNGVVAGRDTKEEPGTESSYFLIPDTLAKAGEHVLALRASQSYLSAHQRGLHVRMADYFQMVRAPLVATALMYVLAGAFFIAAAYFLFLYINSRKRLAVLIFSITCFLFFALIVLEYLKFYVEIPYTYFYTRLQVIGILTMAISFLVPWYFTLQFSFPNRKALLAALLIGLLVIYVLNLGEYDETAQLQSMLLWTVSFIVAAFAAYRMESGGWIVLVGLLLSALIHTFVYYDISVFLSFTIVILCMLYIHTIRIREQEKSYESSLLRSERLKNELLKKNIQPHYLMNTLTSLMDWVEESPKEGVAFIESLASEFELFSSVADSQLIPIHQEIALCQSHLKIMRYRKEIAYHWEEAGIDPKEKVPPALLHTLVENGITHSLPINDGSVRFRLCFQADHNSKKYELYTIARNRSPNTTKAGTGLAYVKARLNESYGSKWDLQSEATSQGWKTGITIYT